MESQGPAPDPRTLDLEDRLEAEIPGLRRFLGSLGGGQESEDVLQDALTRALRYRGAFDPARPLGAWLRRTAFRALLDHRARLGRRPAGLGAEVEALTAREAPGPAAREEVERLLQRLSTVEREVLVGFHQRGESIAELAARLALPPGTVKSHLHRARRRLAAEHQERTR
ncbi:MAG: sigma-70 family RNA polymerase sigma factor [Planctomycetota bacterium]